MKRAKGVSGIIIVDGVSKTRAEWCAFYGITSSLLNLRVKRYGISIEEAVRMGGRKGNAIDAAKQAKASIPLPNVPLRQCANDPNFYVTEDGRVWNHRLKRWMVVTTQATNRTTAERQYARVRIGGQRRYVQTVVAEAWVENPDGLPNVLHRDNNTLNNHKDNLVWATVRDICEYRKNLQGVSK